MPGYPAPSFSILRTKEGAADGSCLDSSPSPLVPHSCPSRALDRAGLAIDWLLLNLASPLRA